MNSCKKIILGVALMFAVTFSSASALTLDDIELLILLGIIPQEKVEMARALFNGGQPVNNNNNESNPFCGRYTRSLTLGSSGTDVVYLQNALEQDGFLVMPVGVAKGYFGTLLQSALAKWQAYNGIAPATGYFGPVTMAVFSTRCHGDDNGNNVDHATSTLSIREIKSIAKNISDSQGAFSIDFTLEAHGSDVYIPTDTFFTNRKKGEGLAFSIENSDSEKPYGVDVGVSFAAYNSQTGDSIRAFKIPEGKSRSFSLSVSAEVPENNNYRMTLDSIAWSPTNYNFDYEIERGDDFSRSSLRTPWINLSSTSTANTLTVVTPNGGENWEIGVTQTISWTPDPHSQYVRAYLEKKTSAGFQTVGSIVEGARGSILWNGEINQHGNYAEPGEYYIRLVNTKTGESDRSDKPFTLDKVGAYLDLEMHVRDVDGTYHAGKFATSTDVVHVVAGDQLPVTWYARRGSKCEFILHDGAQFLVRKSLSSNGQSEFRLPENKGTFSAVVQCTLEERDGSMHQDSRVALIRTDAEVTREAVEAPPVIVMDSAPTLSTAKGSTLSLTKTVDFSQIGDYFFKTNGSVTLEDIKDMGDFTEAEGTSVFRQRDQVLDYGSDPSANNAADNIYFYVENDGWYNAMGGYTKVGQDTVMPTYLVIRKHKLSPSSGTLRVPTGMTFLGRADYNGARPWQGSVKGAYTEKGNVTLTIDDLVFLKEVTR